MIFWIVFVCTYIVVENIAYAEVQAWLLRRLQPQPRWMIRSVRAWAYLMVGLFLLQIGEPEAWKAFLRDWFYFPMAVEMSWNLLFLQVLFPASLLTIILVRLFRRRSAREEQIVPVDTGLSGLSRRRFLYLLSYGVAPAVTIGMGVHGARSRYDLQLRQFRLPVANLPPGLEGFTIAHISDFHSGIFVGPERLKAITDATNDLKADMIAMTGDVINREMSEFPAALAAMHRMESRHGIYLCEGNHDMIPGGRILEQACKDNGLPLLFDETAVLTINGTRLVLGGISWSQTLVYEQRPWLVSKLFGARQPGDTRILLAHHPHLLDIAQDADVVLSGHTHGGQIMFGDTGLGRLRFKYCSGLFHRANTTLVVSNGCGDWFPCRIGAPAEIGLLTLTAAQPIG